MNRPPKVIFDAVISTMDARLAYEKLTAMGYKVTKYECRIARRVHVQTVYVGGGRPGPIVNPMNDAEQGSAKLEAAICKLYARTAKQRGCKLETAAILLNYTSTQIAKMQAAA